MCMTQPPPLEPDQCLFLDIDGTLVEFTDTPSQTFADDEVKLLLDHLMQRLAGARSEEHTSELQSL